MIRPQHAIRRCRPSPHRRVRWWGRIYLGRELHPDLFAPLGFVIAHQEFPARRVDGGERVQGGAVFCHAEGGSVPLCELEAGREEQSDVEDGGKRVSPGLGEDSTLLDQPAFSTSGASDSPTLNARHLWCTRLTQQFSHFHAQHVFRVSEIERGGHVDVARHEMRMNKLACGGDALRKRR